MTRRDRPEPTPKFEAETFPVTQLIFKESHNHHKALLSHLEICLVALRCFFLRAVSFYVTESCRCCSRPKTFDCRPISPWRTTSIRVLITLSEVQMPCFSMEELLKLVVFKGWNWKTIVVVLRETFTVSGTCVFMCPISNLWNISCLKVSQRKWSGPPIAGIRKVWYQTFMFKIRALSFYVFPFFSSRWN